METRQCQNCKLEFRIEPEDFKFYEKIFVPPPTWCPECQLVRRLLFRNERALYKRREDAENKEIISMYSTDNPFRVYTQAHWQSDKLDPMQYGRDYDFSKPFFEQFKELMKIFPWPALFNVHAVRSEYCNYTTDNKNCYLVFGGDFSEDCAYASHNHYSRDSYDLYWVNKCELSYEDIESENCYKLFFGSHVRDRTDSAFLYDCSNLNNCIGCVNLKNKSYCIFNEQYTKEDYFSKLIELNFGSWSRLSDFKRKFE